jgi:hypothetical protein
MRTVLCALNHACTPGQGSITTLHQQRLAPAADGLRLAERESQGYFRVGQFGAVYTLETRVNEMMLAVSL